MAAQVKAKVPVGSAQWIQDENRQIAQFCTQEVEDFSFSARNEIEWLNEHMAEIFSKNQVNVTEIFKTPGKLRGKTPRTARKRNPLEARQPLTDMFMTNTPLKSTHSDASTPTKRGPKFHVAADPIVSATPKLDNPSTDSSYHGMAEDEMDVEVDTLASSLSAAQETKVDPLPVEQSVNEEQEPTGQEARERTTEGSFHSASEEIAMAGMKNEKQNMVKERAETVDVQNYDSTASDPRSSPGAIMPEFGLNNTMDVVEVDNESVLAENPSLDASHSSSAESSPAKPLLRKSSLTFAALPAREPLTTKKSIGGRISGTTHFDQQRGTIGRGSVLGRYTGGKSLGGLRQADHVQDQQNDEMEVDEPDKPTLCQEETNKPESSKPLVPSKSISVATTVTQPIYPVLAISDTQLPQFEQATAKSPKIQAPTNDDDDDDWIQSPQLPPNNSKRLNAVKQFPASGGKEVISKQIPDGQIRTGNHHSDAPKISSAPKQISVPDSPRDGRELSKRLSEVKQGFNLDGTEAGPLEVDDAPANALNSAAGLQHPSKGSTTPHGTPASKRYVDGPLSASKSKLQSIMKTARGLFTSSAGVSAQAKMETLSPHSMRTRGQTRGAVAAEKPSVKVKPVLVQNKSSTNVSTDREGRRMEEQVCPKISEHAYEGRRTRSSAEKDEKRKEKEARDQERLDPESKQREEAEEQIANLEQHEQVAADSQTVVTETKEVHGAMSGRSSKPVRQSPRRGQNQLEAEKETTYPQGHTAASENLEPSYPIAPPSAQVQANSSLFQKPKDVRRPVKPAKEGPSKAKPQPVAIRVGTLSQRIPLMNAAIPSGSQDTLPPPPARQPGLVKKPSNASISTNNLKSSISSNVGKPKALLAAERKKEQDEKELQRKVEQKREIERKRAAQQEELRRQEQAQQQEAERQRERERMAAAQDPKKLAQRQAIEKRRLENGKKEQQRQAAQQEKSRQLSTSRQELGGNRPPSRLHGIHDYGRPANQAPSGAVRPSVKRVFEPETDEEAMGPVHAQGGSLYQQMDAKRRRTDDEDFLEVAVRPTMLPPKRQSNARKDAPKQSIFGNGYTTSQPPSHSYHQSSSLLKTSTLNHTYQQHQHSNQVSRAGLPHEMAKYTNGKIPFAEVSNPPPKSPMRTRPGGAPPAKSSPQYVNGENIDLAEIPTDSEDEDSGDEKAKGAMLPDWVQSPQLREQLEIQEKYVDADAVFGPARSPHMEEMFKGREHRFRSRTSSANWAGPDRLTEEEIRNDRAGREKLRRQGGWTFELQ